MRLCPGPEVALDGVPASAYPKYYDSLNITALQYGTSCYMGNYYRSGGFFSSYRDNIPESAYFSLPNDLTLLDRAWGVCSAFTYGALDPPSALRKPTAPIGLVPASAVASSTPTGQAGPQEPIARPIPTLNKPPAQTQVGGQDPNLGPPDRPSGPAQPADEHDAPNHNPQATKVIQHASPDPPALEPHKGSKGTDPSNGDSNDQVDVQDSATNYPHAGAANNDPPAAGLEAANGQTYPKESFSSDPDNDKNSHVIVVKPAKDTSSPNFSADSDDDAANAELKSADESASAKDSSNINSPSNKSPAQSSESDSSDDNVSQNTGSQPGEHFPAAAPSVTTIAGHNIQIPAPESYRNVILVDGQSITAGHVPTTISSTEIALQTNGDLILGTTTYHNLLPTNPLAPGLAPFITTAAGHSIEIVPSQSDLVTIDGQRITAGAAPTIVANTPIALHTNGDLILGTSTIHNVFPTALPTSVFHFPVGSQTITLSSSQVIVDGTTHAPGDAIFTIDNTAISLGSSALIVGSSTIPLTPSSPSLLQGIITTAGGHVLTLLPTGIVISGTTLTANAPAVTISSTRFSYGPNGLMVGTSTIPLVLPTSQPQPLPFTTPPITASSSAREGLGGIILAGIDGGRSARTQGDQNPRPGADAAVFFGHADRSFSRRRRMGSTLVAAAVFLWLQCMG